MRVGIIGAGVSGLCTAKVLREVGFSVVIFEREQAIGGVWTPSRRYSGLTTQSPRDTYSLSDQPMPTWYPEWPSGEQVYDYLASYCDRFDLWSAIRLGVEVIAAHEQQDSTTWLLELSSSNALESSTTVVDHLVVANGVFSTPFIPDIDNKASFEQLGGRVRHTSEPFFERDLSDSDAVVVGYGKSACDSAVHFASRARSTTLITRRLLWKIPTHLWIFPLKNLLLSRFAEALFEPVQYDSKSWFTHGQGLRLRQILFSCLQWGVCRQLGLRDAGLVPEGSIEDIGCSSISTASTGFFEAVADGSIRVVPNVEIRNYQTTSGRSLTLSDGRSIPADIVVFGTGFTQEVPFLSRDVQSRLFDEHGDFALYRNVHPPSVPRISFAGYSSSLISPLNAEVSAHWIAALLVGELTLPSEDQQWKEIRSRLSSSRQRTGGNHARGASIVPFSLRGIDDLLNDLGVRVGIRTRIAEWFFAPDPMAYGNVLEELRQQTSMWKSS
ncbi:flavin-containing monooxygenase [Pseudonocardia alni]|uniref:flavin-containing monooxygenase n=1 Tax=Pseudonocardia alni TaxID=33907 RepID=UPI00280C14A6|nr:NAD(P)/FAD-dependent oxidoreductase [Pseudonocardia alni]